jgi:hypothetical protein
MAESYRRALRMLSVKGGRSLKAAQSSWLRYVSAICLVPFRDGLADPVADNACLKHELRERLNRLDQAGVRLGAFVLNRIDRYEAFPNRPDDLSGGHNLMVVHHVGFPQIDGAGAAIDAWNRAQVKKLPVRGTDDSDESDHISEYTIGCGSDSLLSIKWTEYEYAHGAAHGVYSNGASTILLAPKIRVVTANDLFDAEAEWKTELPTMFWEAFVRSSHVRETEQTAADLIRDAAVKENRWVLTPEGLQIDFSAYEGGSYLGTPGPITVPWVTLKPLLKDNAPPVCRISSM